MWTAGILGCHSYERVPILTQMPKAPVEEHWSGSSVRSFSVLTFHWSSEESTVGQQSLSQIPLKSCHVVSKRQGFLRSDMA